MTLSCQSYIASTCPEHLDVSPHAMRWVYAAMQQNIYKMQACLGHSIGRFVEQAKEFGEAEVWMNERLMRYAPQACAEFITAFVESDKPNSPLWLIWLYEVRALMRSQSRAVNAA